MFDPKKSKYTEDGQVQVVKGIPIKDAMDTTRDYAQKEFDGVRNNYDPERADKLISLFRDNIGEESFEHLVAYGIDVGFGLYSFGDLKENPELGLYLVFRICSIPFLGYMAEFYLGSHQTSTNYDEIFEKGVPDSVSLEEDHFTLAIEDKDLKKPESRLIAGLYGKLLRNEADNIVNYSGKVGNPRGGMT